MLTETEKRILFFEKLRNVSDKWESILYPNKNKLESFLRDSKKYDFSSSDYMKVLESLLFYNVLMYYTNIETLFLTMLKGAKCQDCKEDHITGKEPLGNLLSKIFLLDTEKN